MRVHGLGKRFGRRWVLRGLDFELAEGRSLVVAGRNGSGKSTLLRLIAGLIPASEGEVHIVGGDGAPRNRVGLCSPEQALYEPLTALENLRFFARLRGLRDFSPQECLQEVGLEGRGDDRVATYSTGMKQRLRLALATMHRPPLLLLDEPGAGLDDAGRAVVDSMVERFRQNGIVILATNDRAEYRYADRRLELAG